MAATKKATREFRVALILPRGSATLREDYHAHAMLIYYTSILENNMSRHGRLMTSCTELLTHAPRACARLAGRGTCRYLIIFHALL